MPRKVFFSFHFDNDFWRTQQVRNMNALEGQPLYNANAWEEVKKKGDANIRKWIADNMDGKSCLVVLVGSETASRPWVIHEISKAWSDGRGVLGIRVHKLLGRDGLPSASGSNPMLKVIPSGSTTSLAGTVPFKDPSGADSKGVYAMISANIESWIEEAISTRKNYRS